LFDLADVDSLAWFGCYGHEFINTTGSIVKWTIRTIMDYKWVLTMNKSKTNHRFLLLSTWDPTTMHKQSSYDTWMKRPISD